MARLAIDDLGTEDDLDVLFIAGRLNGAMELGKILRIGEELTSSNGSATADCGDDNGWLAGVGVSEAGDDAVVLIIVGCHLLCAIDDPTGVGWIVAVDDAELSHVGVVGEVIAERLGEAEGPGVIEGSNKGSGAIAEIAQGGALFALELVLLAVSAECCSDADDGVEIIDDDSGEVVL
jgi:hypothetical protein